MFDILKPRHLSEGLSSILEIFSGLEGEVFQQVMADVIESQANAESA